jgi:hypothetical protein
MSKTVLPRVTSAPQVSSFGTSSARTKNSGVRVSNPNCWMPSRRKDLVIAPEELNGRSLVSVLREKLARS